MSSSHICPVNIPDRNGLRGWLIAAAAAPAAVTTRKAAMRFLTGPKGLATSIIHECNDFGLQGLSYCHEKITEYRLKKDDLASLICDCKMWQLICVDPEHLATPEWRKILDHKTFIKNLILFCSIGTIARGFIGEQTSLIGLSATCAPGAHTIDICNSLGLYGDSYHLVRRSNERENMFLTVESLERSKGVSKYARILEYLQSGRKAVIHVNTIPEAYDIYEFLWNHVPPGTSPLHRMQMYHALCTDKYNCETFERIDNDPRLQVVIATVAFTQGINRKKILDSISYNFPLTLDEYWQAKGRAGRNPDVICRGIALVPSSVTKEAKCN
ncbi:hypothetical protein D9758_012310 [Tetrapyrgos nigripes]|uniref:DNA 3'-5' helicase n=1 Tax=Tetrapyrgos nigripes TaxID=182062 RepID=A0A8H5CML1_9AGAR|nr:hypothetical protein D9758_012310 [Tetrapyrgos nigripes]